MAWRYRGFVDTGDTVFTSGSSSNVDPCKANYNKRLNKDAALYFALSTMADLQCVGKSEVRGVLCTYGLGL